MRNLRESGGVSAAQEEARGQHSSLSLHLSQAEHCASCMGEQLLTFPSAPRTAFGSPSGPTRSPKPPSDGIHCLAPSFQLLQLFWSPLLSAGALKVLFSGHFSAFLGGPHMPVSPPHSRGSKQLLKLFPWSPDHPPPSALWHLRYRMTPTVPCTPSLPPPDIAFAPSWEHSHLLISAPVANSPPPDSLSYSSPVSVLLPMLPLSPLEI